MEHWRAFLSAKVEERRRKRRFSLRQLAAMAGFKSPGYLQLILGGARNVTQETARRLAEALAFDQADTEHFLDLVAHAAAEGDPRAREAIEARMRARAFELAARELTSDRSALFRHWYTPLVWALAPLLPRRRLGSWLAETLHPLVDAGDVGKTLDALVEGGFLRVEPASDAFTHDERILSISTPASADVLGRFYLECLGAARKLMGRLDESKRNVRVTTVTLPLRRLDELKARVRSFHGDLAAWASEPEVPGEAMVACQITSAAFFLAPPLEHGPDPAGTGSDSERETAPAVYTGGDRNI